MTIPAYVAFFTVGGVLVVVGLVVLLPRRRPGVLVLVLGVLHLVVGIVLRNRGRGDVRRPPRARRLGVAGLTSTNAVPSHMPGYAMCRLGLVHPGRGGRILCP